MHKLIVTALSGTGGGSGWQAVTSGQVATEGSSSILLEYSSFGTYIVFARSDNQNNIDLYVLDFDGTLISSDRLSFVGGGTRAQIPRGFSIGGAYPSLASSGSCSLLIAANTAYYVQANFNSSFNVTTAIRADATSSFSGVAVGYPIINGFQSYLGSLTLFEPYASVSSSYSGALGIISTSSATIEQSFSQPSEPTALMRYYEAGYNGGQDTALYADNNDASALYVYPFLGTWYKYTFSTGNNFSSNSALIQLGSSTTALAYNHGSAIVVAKIFNNSTVESITLNYGTDQLATTNPLLFDVVTQVIYVVFESGQVVALDASGGPLSVLWARKLQDSTLATVSIHSGMIIDNSYADSAAQGLYLTYYDGAANETGLVRLPLTDVDVSNSVISWVAETSGSSALGGLDYITSGSVTTNPTAGASPSNSSPNIGLANTLTFRSLG